MRGGGIGGGGGISSPGKRNRFSSLVKQWLVMYI